MPRRSAQGSGSLDGSAVSVMEAGTGAPVDAGALRPDATVTLETVNVFLDTASEPAPGLRLASLGGRTLGEAVALSVQAWVRNLAYDKEVWIDVRLLGGGGEVLHAESLPLQYQGPAEGGGDFFGVDATVPTSASSDATVPEPPSSSTTPPTPTTAG